MLNRVKFLKLNQTQIHRNNDSYLDYIHKVTNKLLFFMWSSALCRVNLDLHYCIYYRLIIVHTYQYIEVKEKENKIRKQVD